MFQLPAQRKMNWSLESLVEEPYGSVECGKALAMAPVLTTGVGVTGNLGYMGIGLLASRTTTEVTKTEYNYTAQANCGMMLVRVGEAPQYINCWDSV